MTEEAVFILDYLPLKQSERETAYVSYLWRAFETLATGREEVVPFSLTAFHLLFVLAIQHKVLRIKQYLPGEYEEYFTAYPPRNERVRVLTPGDVFDLSFVNEKSLMHLLSLAGLDSVSIDHCKNLIDVRNNEFMHASGNIPNNPVNHINNCLTQLSAIQNCFTAYNDHIAQDWTHELTAEDDIPEFVDLRLFETQLATTDFSNGDLRNLFGFAVGI